MAFEMMDLTRSKNGFVVVRDSSIAFTMAWLLVLMIVVSAFFAVLLPLIFLVEEAS